LLRSQIGGFERNECAVVFARKIVVKAVRGKEGKGKIDKGKERILIPRKL
jgi:hypothetical protein